MEFEILKTLFVIFGLSAFVVFILNKLKVPSLVGFLVTGAFLGPHGFGFIRNVGEVELLAEIGIILLLFTIGLEISLKNLRRIRSAVLGGGLFQMALTFGAASAIVYPFLWRWNQSIFIGFLVSLSSTAVVMRMLFDRAELDSPHGRLSIGILIFQDLCVVPLMLLIPILSGDGGSFFELSWTMIKSGMIIFSVIFGARWLVPNILHQIVRTRNRELFIITVILLCLGTALLTASFGLSLALGAFLAGLIISESEYAYQATSDILPFRDSFSGLFFISVGMLMDIGFLTKHFLIIFCVVAAILVLKTVAGFFSIRLLGHPFRVSVQTGLCLAQIGEFSFVLATAGKAAGLLADNNYQLFLSASILTLLFTPLIISGTPAISTWLSSKEVLNRLDRIRKTAERESFPQRREEHVIIIGFGFNGRNVAEVLKEVSVPYVILEINNDTVLQMKKRGEPIFYGDGASLEVLRKLDLTRAKMLVVAISDPASTRRIVQLARNESARVYILVRTRYTAEVEDLLRLGANEVIPEEYETAIEISARVLHHYQVPRNLIFEQVERIRSGNYKAIRKMDLPAGRLPEKCELIADIETESYSITNRTSVVGRSIQDIQIRSRTGATVIAVKRGERLITSPEPGFVFKSGDIVYLIGARENVRKAIKLIEEIEA